jgi:hypothetical protein
MAQGPLALALVIVFLAQTAFFAAGVWDNRAQVSLKDIIFGPICSGSGLPPAGR